MNYKKEKTEKKKKRKKGKVEMVPDVAVIMAKICQMFAKHAVNSQMAEKELVENILQIMNKLTLI